MSNFNDRRELDVRLCATCTQPLVFHVDGFQEGIFCCDLYYHEGECLDKQFEGSGTTWERHYIEMGGDDYGECYFSDWEPEYITEKEIA